jgi:hypothetical protein
VGEHQVAPLAQDRAAILGRAAAQAGKARCAASMAIRVSVAPRSATSRDHRPVGGVGHLEGRVGLDPEAVDEGGGFNEFRAG